MKPLSIAAVPLMLVLVACGAAPEQISRDEGRPQVPWQQARPLIGQVAFVFGKVVDVRKSGNITFINFDKQRPARFSGVIFDDKLANFTRSPEELYAGKIVRIRGTVSAFKNQPQIVVTSPEQVEVLDAMPKTSLPKNPAPPQSKPGELVVAAYNLFNLFDEHDDPYRDDEGTRAKPRAEMERLAQSIRQLNADVLAVEEVENRDYLERFVNVFLADMGYNHVVLYEGNDGRGIDVGLLSRAPIGQVQSNRHLTFDGPEGDGDRFQRDVLEVSIEPVDGKPFEVWIVHLKSNAGGREEAEPIRLAEARQLRRMLDAELSRDPSSRIIVAGDFNDTAESKTLQTIVGQNERALWSVDSELNNPELVTYNQGDHRSVIDFILCSPAMARQYVKGSCRIPQGSVETTGSDHNPIAATFSVK